MNSVLLIYVSWHFKFQFKEKLYQNGNLIPNLNVIVISE